MTTKRADDLAPGDIVDFDHPDVVFGSDVDAHVADTEGGIIEAVKRGAGGWVTVYLTPESPFGNPIAVPADTRLELIR